MLPRGVPPPGVAGVRSSCTEPLLISSNGVQPLDSVGRGVCVCGNLRPILLHILLCSVSCNAALMTPSAWLKMSSPQNIKPSMHIHETSICHTNSLKSCLLKILCNFAELVKNDPGNTTRLHLIVPRKKALLKEQYGESKKELLL